MANQALSVRAPTEDDVATLLTLRARFFEDQFTKGQRERAEDHKEWLQDSTAKLLKNKRATLFLIESDQGPVGYGYGSTRVTPKMENPVVSSVEEFMIEQYARGKAAGTLLFEAMRADFISRGADRIQLRVLSQNEEGHGFWAALGFEPYLTTYELAG